MMFGIANIAYYLESVKHYRPFLYHLLINQALFHSGFPAAETLSGTTGWSCSSGRLR